MVESDSIFDDVTLYSILAELTTKMTKVMNCASGPPQISSDNAVTPIDIELDDNNYPLWFQVIEMYISENTN